MKVMTQEEYDLIPAARAPFLKNILRSPKHALTPREQLVRDEIGCCGFGYGR